MSDTHLILIVDDSEDNRTYLSEILEEYEYEYAVAKDGREAIESMKNRIPDLVLLDIMMPRKNGVVVFEQMKRDPELEKIPIVFVTGASEVTGVNMKSGEEQPKEGYEDDLNRGFGALLRERLSKLTPDGFLDKPVEPQALVSKIKSLLE